MIDFSSFSANYSPPYDQWYLSNGHEQYLSGGRVVGSYPEYFNTQAEANEELTRLKEKNDQA